jgi:hypothetical protein
VAAPTHDVEHDDRPLTLCCIRCGGVLLAAGTSDTLKDDFVTGLSSLDGAVEVPAELDPLADFDTWELEEQLRHVERILALPGFNAPPAAAHGALRFDTPAHPSLRHRKPLVSFVAWTFLIAGLAASTCGAVLTGWSVAAQRDELWHIGLPTASAGVLALLIGLVFQLGLVWHAYRGLAADLAVAEAQLGLLTRPTSASRGAPPAPVASA